MIIDDMMIMMIILNQKLKNINDKSSNYIKVMSNNDNYKNNGNYKLKYSDNNNSSNNNNNNTNNNCINNRNNNSPDYKDN